MTRSKIRTSGAEGLTLSSTSLTVANGLTLTDGDITFADTHGLNFAATGDGSGTDSSELLHDYEEGTWTPSYEGSSDPTVSYDSLRFGYYTKIGRHVFVIGRVRTDSVSGGSGDLEVTGLPYTESGINGDNYTSGGGVVSDAFGSNNPHSTMILQNANLFYLIYGTYSVLNCSHLATGANSNQIQFSLHYMTDA